MELLGFSFGFGARDAGLSSAFANTTRSLRNIGGEVSKLGGIAKSVDMGAMFAGFGTAALSKISDDLGKITGGNENLVNSLESTMAEYSKQTRIIGAQAGYTGAALDRFASSTASLAYSMKIAPDAVAKAQKSFNSLGEDFRQELQASGMGLRDFLMAQEATGMQSEDLIKQLDGLHSTFGFTASEAMNLLDSYTAVARGSGNVDKAFSKFGESLSNVNDSLVRNVAALGLNEDQAKEYIRSQILGQQKLAGALAAAGAVPSDKAQEAAAAFAKAMADSQNAISSMLSGLDGSTTEIFNTIAQEAGSTDIASMIIGQSPEAAMKNLLTLRNALTDKGQITALQRLDSKLQDISPDLIFRSLGNKEVQDKFLAQIDTLTQAAEESTGAFEKFGKETYRALILPPEQIDRAKQAMESRLAALGGGVQEYTNFQVRSFKQLGDAVAEYASDKTWGPLTRRFALATREGIGAFFMPMRQEGESLRNQLAALGEASAMGGLRGRLEAIRQLGVAGLFYDLTRGSSDAAGAMEAAYEKASTLYAKLLLVKKGFDVFLPVIIAVGGAIGGLFALNRVFGILTTTLGNIVGPIFRVVGALGTLTASIIGWPATVFLALVGFVALWEKLPAQVKEQLDKVLELAAGWIGRLADKLATIDGEAIGGRISNALRSVAETIRKFLSGEALAKEASGFEKFIYAIADVMKQSWRILADALKVVLKTMFEDPDVKKYLTIPLGVAVAGPPIAEMAVGFASAIVGAITTISLSTIMPVLKAWATKVALPAIKTFLTDTIAPLLADLVAAVLGFLGGTTGIIIGIVAGLFVLPYWVGTFTDETKKKISNLLDGIGQFFADFSTNLMNWARELGPKIGRGLESFFNLLSLDFLPSGKDMIERVLKGFMYLTAELGPKIIATVKQMDLTGAAIAFVDSMFGATTIDGAIAGIDWKALIGQLAAFVGGIFMSLFPLIGFVAELLWAIVLALADAIGAAFIALLGGIGKVILSALTFIVKSISNLIADILDLVRGVVRLVPGLDDTEWKWLDSWKNWGVTTPEERKAIEKKQAADAERFGVDIGNATAESLNAGVQQSLDKHKPGGMLSGWFGADAVNEQRKEMERAHKDAIDSATNMSNDWSALGSEALGADPSLGMSVEPSMSISTGGIKAGISDFVSGATSGASSIVGALPDFFGAGVQVMEGTADGIKVGAKSAANATIEAQNQIRALMPHRGTPIPANLPLADVVDAGAEIMFRIAEGMINGTSFMMNAMANAYLGLQAEMEVGNINLTELMKSDWDMMGREVSNVFAQAVLAEQEMQIANIHQSLRDLFNKEYTSVKIQEVSTTATATLEFDSVKTITDAVNNMANLVVGRLDTIAQNTADTAMNTDSLRIRAASQSAAPRVSAAGATGAGG